MKPEPLTKEKKEKHSWVWIGVNKLEEKEVFLKEDVKSAVSPRSVKGNRERKKIFRIKCIFKTKTEKKSKNGLLMW